MENNIKWLTRTAALLAVALVFQMGGFPQFITGPVVNTVLYLATLLVGIWSGVIIGIFTPVIAFIRGILPPPLAPMIPFIALGNGLLVLIFGLLKKKNQLLGVMTASVVKFLVLAGAVNFLVAVPARVAQAMSLPQLFTALTGGVIALIVFKALQNTGLNLEGEKYSSPE